MPERAGAALGGRGAAASSDGCRPAPATRATYERAVAKVRAQLPEETFMVAWAEGQAMNLEQAVTYALQES